MKIAYDHQIFCIERFGGISRYFSELVANLAAEGDDAKIFAPFHQNHYLKNLPQASCSGHGFKKFPRKISRIATHVNRVITNNKIKQWQPDILHLTYYEWPQLVPKGIPIVVTVHDMNHELQPHLFGRMEKLAERKAAAVKNADHVICISQNTKMDMMEILGTPETKISVIYHGVSVPRKLTSSVSSVPRPYILYVGARAVYKNFSALIQAVAHSPRLLIDFDIIAFGGQQFTKAEREEFHALGLSPNQVRQISGSDDLLQAHYKNASVFVYPSLYEGFGFPPLEAMLQNCPVVSSNTSSMPEIIGTAAEFFDPSDREGLTHAIETVVYSSVRAAELATLGRARVKRFTWEKCAQETLSTYRQIS